jgi:predicted TIM-barrel fold metal-dependent hydrolase
VASNLRTVIDGYTHNVPRNYLRRIVDYPDPRVSKPAIQTKNRADTHPNLVDFGRRIQEMDKYGISKQVTCIYQGIDPNHLPVAKSDQLELCKIINDDLATDMQKHRDRVVALGTAPLLTLKEGGIEEMRRAVKDLGLKGFMAVTNVGGEPVDHFQEFWEEAGRLGVPVYIHPIDPVTSSSRPYEDEYDLMHVLGWPFETSLTVARLVLSGTMERNPGLKVMIHHLGAMIPFFAGRINESYAKEMSLVKPEQDFHAVKGSKPAMSHFGGFYLDTAIGGNKAAIECAKEVFGVEKIIFGTDYPFGPSDGILRLEKYPGIVEDTSFTTEEKELVFEENISKLLKL